MTLAGGWPRLLGVLAGAAIGWGTWEAVARGLPEVDTQRWTLRGASVPVEVPGSAGPLRADPAALDLWAYRGASPRIAPFAEGTVALDARIPDGAQLVLRLGAETIAGPVQPVRFGGEAGSAEGPVQPPPKSPGGAQGANAGPGAPSGPGGPGGPPPGGPAAPPPKQAELGVSVIVDRSARNAILGRNLTCEPAAAPPAEARLQFEARGGEITVSADGAQLTRCRGTWAPGALVLGSGMRRIQLDDLRVSPVGVPAFSEKFGGPYRSRFAGVLAALLGAALGSRVRARGVALALLPTWLLPVLGRLDVRGFLDTLRLLEVPAAFGPPLLVGLPTAVALLLVAGAGAATPRSAALRGLGGLAVGALGAALAPDDVAGWLLLGALGVPLAVLAHVNTHPFARRVPLSWALCLVLALGTEGALRLTSVDKTWTPTAGWRRASQEFSELVELRRYRAYPDEGFPIRPPDPDPTRRRIVALGGSSTGGAYQMDDIEQFWPRRLADRLGGTDWEVVNQGVGGWNTLHIRLYVESQIERLDADVLVLYVGHNDILSTAPVSYREMYAAWSQGSSRVRAVSDALNASRLYVGLKYALLSLRAREGAVAVPVSDARDNLAAIARLAAEHRARVLFVTEGLNPDPLPMRAYGDMQAALAKDTGGLYLDGADLLWRTGDPELFLDDCHLSVPGHTRLAEWIHDALRSAGWLERANPPRPPNPAPGPPR